MSPLSDVGRSSTGATASWRSVATFLAAAGAVALTFHRLLTGDEVPLYRDALFFVVPFKHYLTERLQQGELALWNPYVFLGTPFLASLQTGVLYPPSVLFLLGFPAGFCLFVVAHALLALGGTWAFLRERGLGPSAAAVGSATFAIGGFSVSMLSLTSILQTLAWTPWILLATSRLRSGLTAGRIVSLAAFLFLQILAGSPEVLAMTLFVAATWAAFAAEPRGRETVLAPVRVGVVAAFAAGLAAFQILPTAEYVGESARRAALSLAEVTKWSLEPVALLQLLFPPGPFTNSGEELAPFFSLQAPWVYSLYLGVVPLGLAVAGLGSGRERVYWGALLAAGLLLALGDRSPVFVALYEIAPGLVGKFRFPEKLWFLSHVAAAVLAAEGADRLLRGDTRARRLAAVAAATLCLLGGLVWLAGWTRPGPFLAEVARWVEGERPPTAVVDLAADVRHHAGRIAVLLAVFFGLAVSTASRRAAPALVGALLVLVVLVDLVPTQRIVVATIPWEELRDRPPLPQSAELRERHRRVFHYDVRSSETDERIPGLDQFWIVPKGRGDLGDFYGELWRTRLMNAIMVDRVETLSGADGIARESDGMLRRALSIVPRETTLRLLRIFSVENLVGPVPLRLPGLEPIPADPPSPYHAYRLEGSLPIAYLVTRLREAPSRVAAFNAMVASDFDPGAEAIVAALPEAWVDTPDAGGRATILAREPERVRIAVETHRRALLVLNDSDFPGWEARVDGKLRPIVRTNAIVRGVILDPGDRIVEFAYRPASFRIGAAISVGSFVVLLLAAAAIARRRDARPGSAPTATGRRPDDPKKNGAGH